MARHVVLGIGLTFLLAAAGCGGSDKPTLDQAVLPDLDVRGDQGLVDPCATDNGGCSMSPLVSCGTTSTGEVLCGACPTGYVGDGRVCTMSTPVDECAEGTDTCDVNARCIDTPTSYSCECNPGYSGDGFTCEDNACSGVADCDDGIACTVDTCESGGACGHELRNDLCPTGSLCSPTAGCVVSGICSSSTDCVDTDPCTVNERCITATATCARDFLDSDGDGEVPLVCGGTDCDDSRPDVGATSPEICDGADNDCDEIVDTDATLESDPELRYEQSNCGACGVICRLGETCYQGACEPCGGGGQPCCGAECDSETSCSSGTCVVGNACEVSGGSALCVGDSCGGPGQPCCAGLCAGDSICFGDACTAPHSDCDGTETPERYRVTMLRIPTSADVDIGNPLGHNVDGVGTVCFTPDYIGDVDNSFLDLAATLPLLGAGAGLDLNAELAAAVACVAPSSTCSPLWLELQVINEGDCTQLTILDATDATVLLGPVPLAIDDSGNFAATSPRLDLFIPVDSGAGFVDVSLTLSGAIVTGNVSGGALSDVVIGGYLEQTSFEATISVIVPLISDQISVDEVLGILGGLYDVQSSGTQCDALSVGLVGSGVMVTD